MAAYIIGRFHDKQPAKLTTIEPRIPTARIATHRPYSRAP
jgi:hypothetical protein